MRWYSIYTRPGRDDRLSHGGRHKENHGGIDALYVTTLVLGITHIYMYIWPGLTGCYQSTT